MTVSRTLGEWIKLYEEKTGDKVDLPKDYRLFYMAERGFAQMKPDDEGKMLIINHVCGDGKFWHDVAELVAVQHGLTCLGTLCTRRIKPYIRAFGWKIEKRFCFISPDSNPGKVEYRYLCRDGIGRAVVITESGIDEKGNENYLVTHYLQQGVEPDLQNAAGAVEVSLEGGGYADV